MRGWFRGSVKAIVKFLVRLLLRLEVEGLEQIPDEGASILAISHTNFLDPVLVFAVSPRPVEALSKVENKRLFILGPMINWYGAIFVRRGEVDRGALSTAIQVLERGELLIIAPEGTRSGDGRLLRGRGGLAYIASRTGVPIVPVGIVGGEKFWPHLFRLRRTPVEMTFGRPFRFDLPPGPVDRRAMDRMTTEAMYQLAALLPPERRGRYADLENATETLIWFPDGTGNLEGAER
jgi:1-acyl-sn-glycerol-3-phosphate acyltransferase